MEDRTKKKVQFKVAAGEEYRGPTKRGKYSTRRRQKGMFEQVFERSLSIQLKEFGKNEDPNGGGPPKSSLNLT